MKLICPGKVKRRRYDRLKSIAALNRILTESDYNRPVVSVYDDDYEADDEEFEDLEDTESAFDIAIEIAGDIW